MTRKETINKLRDVQDELKEYPDCIGFGDPRFFKFWRLLWEEKALEMSLEYGKDLNSVIHPNQFKDGEGIPFKE